MEPVVRVLAASDVGSFRELKIEAVTNHPSAFVSSPEEERSQPLQKVLDSLDSKSESANATFGGFHEGRLVGMATAFRLPYKKKAHKMFISGMYVQPAFRRMGIGAQLLATIVEHASLISGIKRIELAVESENESAKRFYASMGFERWGTEPETFVIDGNFYDADYLSLRL